MALVGTKVKELRKALGVVGGSAPAAEAGGGEEEEEEEEEGGGGEMEPADGGHGMYLSAWIWCRDEHKKGGGGVHKIRTRALGVAQFSRFVPSAGAILDAAKNDLKEPRGYTKSTRVPHMPKDATGAVAEVAVAMRGKKPPTSQSVVFNIVKAYLVDTEHELLFREEAQEGKAELGPWKEKKLQDWFYRQLLSHPKLNGAGNQGALDTTGAKWMTAKGLFAT
jgi:hypothetical protein